MKIETSVRINGARLLCVAVLVMGAAMLWAPTAGAASDRYVTTMGTDAGDCSVSPCLTLGYAIGQAAAGDTIHVAAGTYVLGNQLDINKANLTLTGAGSASTLIQVSGAGYRFYISASGVTLQGFQIEKTDKTGLQNIIYIGANNVTVKDNLIFGRYVLGDPEVSRAFEVAYGTSGLQIEGNTIHSLRQPGYLNGSLASPTTGEIKNNIIYNTRGWVLAGAAPIFTGNTWGTGNILDIVILSGTDASYYPDIVAVSNANNAAVVEDQRPVPAVLSVVYVNAAAAPGGNGGKLLPYQTIGAAITRAVARGTINVAAGTYHEQITIAKPLTIRGSDGAILDGTGLAPQWTTGVKIKSSNVTFDNIDVTNYTQDGITAYMKVSMPNLHITNSKISNIQPGYWGFGIYVGYESEGFEYIPPHLTQHLDFSGLLIEGNEIVNTHSSALVLQSFTGTPGTLIVRNNNIHDNTTNSGIWIDCARELLIENNIVQGNKVGVEISAIPEMDGNPASLDGPYGPKNIVLRGNQIVGNAQQGIAFFQGWPSTFVVERNAIQGNGQGAENYLVGSAILDARCNWWGAADGPGPVGSGSGDKVSANVTFDPWLTTTDLNSTCAANPVPVITDVSPTSKQMGDPEFTLTVNGTGFVSTSKVQWNGAERQTTYMSSTQLQAAILAADIANTDVGYITVVNPPPGGGTSNVAGVWVTPQGAAVVEAGIQSGNDPTAQTPSGSIVAVASGPGLVSVASYAADPAAAPPSEVEGSYMDVHIGAGSEISSLKLSDCGHSATSVTHWWNGTAWLPVAPQAYNAATGCIEFTILAQGTSPTLGELSGTPIGAFGPAAPPTPVPTLTEWGLLILVGLVVAYSVWTLRRRRLAGRAVTTG